MQVRNEDIAIEMVDIIIIRAISTHTSYSCSGQLLFLYLNFAPSILLNEVVSYANLVVFLILVPFCCQNVWKRLGQRTQDSA